MSVEFAHLDEKNIKPAVRWMVTVEGFDGNYGPPVTRTTIILVLAEGETPVEWMLTRPICYERFSFTPNALLGFWRIGETRADLSDGPRILTLADVGPDGEKKRPPSADDFDGPDDAEFHHLGLPRHYNVAENDEASGTEYVVTYKDKEIGSLVKTRRTRDKTLNTLWIAMYKRNKTSEPCDFEKAVLFIVDSDVALRKKKG